AGRPGTRRGGPVQIGPRHPRRGRSAGRPASDGPRPRRPPRVRRGDARGHGARGLPPAPRTASAPASRGVFSRGCLERGPPGKNPTPPGAGFLAKPFTPQALSMVVLEALAEPV